MTAPMEDLIEAGIQSAKQGKPAEALARIRQAADSYPDRHEPHYLLGCMLASTGRHEEAITSLRRSLKIKSPNVEAALALIFSLRRAARYDEAEAETRRWAEIEPESPGPSATLAHIFLEQNRLAEALAEAVKSNQLAPASTDAITLVAHILARLGRSREAIAKLNQASVQAPDSRDIHLHLGNISKLEGRFDEAAAALRRALEIDPANTAAIFELAEITRFKADDPLVASMEQLAQRETAGLAPVSSKLHFALGKAYDDIGQPSAAFRHFAIANAHEPAAKTYNEKGTLAVLERMEQIFTPATLDRLKRHGNPSRLPIFIVGMPRSGTTLQEQILASHPAVAAGGELQFFGQAVEALRAARSPARAFPDGLEALDGDDIARIAERYLSCLQPLSEGRAHVTDKLPANSLLLGLIHCILPNAKIVYCLRDPMDTCLSCFMKSFGPRVPYSTDLGRLGRYHRAHARLMGHWRDVLPAGSFLEVRYENVVENIERQARRLLAYCGLEWDERCLVFHENRRPVATASLVQVREPIYSASVGRWRKYSAHLGPLLSALGGFQQ